MDRKTKDAIRNMPVVGPLAARVYHALRPARPPQEDFPGSADYWEKRYARGGDSGDGSYGKLAQFKADVINAFVAEHNVHSVIEYGCGDGSQLELATYPHYIGFDVSETILGGCRKRFSGDDTKVFHHVSQALDASADLTLSLDVIYHLVEDDVFDQYMKRLFDSSNRFVIVYSSNHDAFDATFPHVRDRKFTSWVDANRPSWHLMKHIANEHPFNDKAKQGSRADFYVFQKQA